MNWLSRGGLPLRISINNLLSQFDYFDSAQLPLVDLVIAFSHTILPFPRCEGASSESPFSQSQGYNKESSVNSESHV